MVLFSALGSMASITHLYAVGYLRSFPRRRSARRQGAKATSPTAAQATAARTEVWNKAGLATAQALLMNPQDSGTSRGDASGRLRSCSRTLQRQAGLPLPQSFGRRHPCRRRLSHPHPIVSAARHAVPAGLPDRRLTVPRPMEQRGASR